MSMRSMKTLKDILCKELDEYAYKGQVSRGDLVDIDSLTNSIKNIEKIIMMDGQGNSFDGSSRRSGASRARDVSYGDGYAMRSNSGRSEASSRRSYSSYGEDNEMVMDKLEEMLSDEGMSSDEKNIMRMAMDILKK